MPQTITLVHSYPVAATDLWNVAIDYDCLRYVMKGLATFTGLPKGIAQTGQKLNIEVSLFGKLPKQAYFMEILECNHEKKVLRSFEHGAGVRSWYHTVSIEPTETGSTLRDEIILDAGLLTPLFVLWARYMYNARHQPRLKLLQEKLM